MLFRSLRRSGPATRFVWFGVIMACVIAASLNAGPVQLILFVAGMTLFELINSLEVRPPSNSVGLIVFLAGLGATLLPLEGPVGFTIRTCILFVAFGVVCMVAFCRTEGWFSRSLTFTPLRWLGNMSYSYYLLHGLTLKGAFLALGMIVHHGEYGHVFFWSLLPVMFAVSLVPPAILFLTIERPMSLAVKRPLTSGTPAIDSIPKPLEAAG